MTNRKSLTQKIRFEVFKRDSFTCQYCGEAAPKVVLEVDHIKPVSKGGDNNLLNLITSCYDCNRGKTNTELRDDSIISKQHKQLALIQERREQLELMFEWKQELDNLKNDTDKRIINIIEGKIEGTPLTDLDEKNISKLSEKYELSDILEAIDLSAHTYLKYDRSGNLNQESIRNYLDKIPGILVNKTKPPIEQKISYIKGICKNRFNYYNPKTASIILNNYIQLLRKNGYNEKDILSNLENEIIKKTKEVPSWKEWCKLIRDWTENNTALEKEETESNTYKIAYQMDQDELDECVNSIIHVKECCLPAITYIGEAFKDFEQKKLINEFNLAILAYLKRLKKDSHYLECPPYDYAWLTYDANHFLRYETDLFLMFKPYNKLTSCLVRGIESAFEEIITTFWFYVREIYSEKTVWNPESLQYIIDQFYIQENRKGNINNFQGGKIENQSYTISQDQLNEFINILIKERVDVLPPLIYMGVKSNKFQKIGLLDKIDLAIITYLEALKEYYNTFNKEGKRKPRFTEVAKRTGLLSIFDGIDPDYVFIFDPLIYSTLSRITMSLDRYDDKYWKPEYLQYIIDSFYRAIASNGRGLSSICAKSDAKDF